MRLQAVLLRQDEPRRGQDRHDSATALPVDGRATGLRGGGTVPGYRGVTAGFSEKRLSIRALRMSSLRDLDPVCLSRLKEVKVSSAPFLLLRIPSLKLRVHGRKEAFEANLKTETDLWNLMVKEMWAGRNMADQHKVQR